MSTRRIQVILTDIGRVVLDVHEERAIERLTELSGIDVARLWSVLIAGPDIERHVQTGQSSMRDIYGTHLGEMHASVSYDEFAEALTTELGDDYPQVRRAYESLPPHRIMKPLGGRVYVQRYGPMHVAGHGDKGIRRHAGKMVGNAPYTARTVAPAAFTSMTPSTTSPRRRPCPFVHTVTRYPPDEAQSYPLMRTDRRW